MTPEQKKAYIKDGGIPEPTYGGQLQDFALQDQTPEGKIEITYTNVPVKFKDGTTVTLRKPHLNITDLGYGDMHPDTEFSARGTANDWAWFVGEYSRRNATRLG